MAAAVDLIFGAFGRQVDDHILEAYHLALQDATDYQLQIATRVEVATRGEHPITAGRLRDFALNQPRYEGEPERLTPPKQEGRDSKARQAFRDAVAELLPDWDLDKFQKPKRKHREAAKTSEQLQDEIRRATRGA